jgi:hypothetical protein
MLPLWAIRDARLEAARLAYEATLKAYLEAGPSRRAQGYIGPDFQPQHANFYRAMLAYDAALAECDK